jgi:hypothetical protein
MPTAPVQIIANGAGSTPTAPVQIAANGSGSTPTAPPTVTGSTANLDPGVIIGGTLSPDVTGYLRILEFDQNGRPAYGTAAGASPGTDAWTRLYHTGTRWELIHYATGETGPEVRWRSSTSSTATPDLASGWAPVSGDPDPTGTPTFTVIPKATPVVQIQESGDVLFPPAIRVTGTMTRNGSTPLVFPILLRTVNFNGRPCWTQTGEDYESELAGNYFLFWDADLYSWTLAVNSSGYFGFGGGDDDSPMTVDDWAPLGTETGLPTLTAAPAAPAQITANGSGSTPAAPPAIV